MKKQIHSPATLAFRLLAMLAFWNLAAPAWSQTDVHRPLEFGLLIRESIWNHQSSLIARPRNWTSFEASFSPYVQVSGPRGRFLRLGVGLDMYQGHGTFNETPTFKLEERLARNALRTSAVYGWEFHPFEGSFAQRFGFRFGAGLEHAIVLQDLMIRESTQVDTSNGNISFNQSQNTSWGNQFFTVLGVAQVNFKVVGGLTLGLEWRGNSSLEIQNLHQRIEVTRGGTGQVTTTEVRRTKTGIGIGQLHFGSYPSLLLAWRI